MRGNGGGSGEFPAWGWDTLSSCWGQLPPLPLLSPAAGTCGVLLRKVNGTAIVQLPSKRQMQVEKPSCPCPGRAAVHPWGGLQLFPIR